VKTQWILCSELSRSFPWAHHKEKSYSFLTAALDVDGWPALRADRFIPEIELRGTR
jgi:hypothetical protein